MKVIIPCAGMATRWHGDRPKQLVKVLGEPILHRTVRLIREIRPDANVSVIVKDTKDDWFKVPGARRVAAKLDPSRSQADKFLSSRHLWSKTERTVVLWGDVFFTRDAMERILGFDEDWAMFARLGPSNVTGKDHKEPFGFSFTPEAIPTLDAGIQRCVDEARAGTLTAWSGSWQVYKAAQGVLHKRWSELTVDELEHVRVIDDATDDFDYPQDWDEWCYRYANFTPEERAYYGMVS